MDDIPWIPIVVVAIAFLNWLIGKIKEASEIRREQRKSREYQRHKSGQSMSPPEAQQPPQHQPTQQQQPQRAPATLKELMEQALEPERPTRKRVPPPIPQTTQKRRKPAPEGLREVIKEKQAAKRETLDLPDLSAVQAAQSVTDLSTKPSRRKSKFAKMLRDSDQLRNAVILKEILDQPKGLQ